MTFIEWAGTTTGTVIGWLTIALFVAIVFHFKGKEMWGK